VIASKRLPSSLATWPMGQITIQGRLVAGPEAAPSVALAVTGGTGTCSNARGYVTGEPIEGSMDSTITFFLIP